MSTAQLVRPHPVCVLWGQTSIPAFRACDLCTHGTDLNGVRHCTRREVIGNRWSLPVEDARKPHGPCGGEAVFLDFPGLHA